MNKNQFTNATSADVVPKSGKKMGGELGRAERIRFFQKLRDSVPTEVVSEENFGERLGEKTREKAPDLLLAGNRMIAQKLRHVDRFVPSWRGENHPYSGLPGYEGRLGNVPLCTVSEGTDSVVAVTFDGSVQVKRIQQGDGEALHVRIEHIDDEKAEHLLNKNPNLEDGFESEHEAIRHMKQRVLLDVSEHIKFEFGEGGVSSELLVGGESQ